ALRDAIDSLRRNEDFDVDFVRARRAVLTELLGESNVTWEVAGRLLNLELFHLPPDYYDQLLQRIAAVSPAQVRALVEAELKPENEIVVVLGDAPSLTKTFEGAGITDVKIVQPLAKTP